MNQSAGVTIGFLGLHHLVARGAGFQPYESQVPGYGDLIPDPHRILDLPEGFEYQVLSREGTRMHDNLFVPGKPDGMAAFRGPGDHIILVRNHELSPEEVFHGAFGLKNQLRNQIPAEKFYDPGKDLMPYLGGTSTVIYNPKTGRVVREFLSLAGTSRNCAGGPTPWGSWITCEEPAELGPGEFGARGHGYNFEVPATFLPELANPIPLKAMGRFRHEAVAVDPRSGIVYQTEDMGDGLIYRFIPDRPGHLQVGGKLQALMVLDRPSLDTRNWPKESGAGKLVEQGQALPVTWVDLEDIDSEKDDLRIRGHKAGAAVFARGEGMWFGQGQVYFACTNGGPIGKGQIWKYIPSPYEGTELESTFPGKLELFIESEKAELLEFADNLTVAPWGDLVLAEDGASTQYLRGVTPEGKLYALARNRYNESEFAGVCFAPHAPILFVNIQSPGITLAITGPWQKFARQSA